MRHDPLDPAVFTAHRRRLVEVLPPRSVAIVHAADILPTNGDGTLRLHPAGDLFWLTGIEQEESVLVLAPHAVDPAQRETLYLRQPTEQTAQWEGVKLDQERATAVSGVARVRWIAELPAALHALLADADVVLLNANEHERSNTDVEPRDLRMARRLMERYPLHRYERLAPLLHHLRAEKSEIEIGLVQRACDITAKGFERLLGFVKPGVTEYEVEAELLHEFVRHGSRGFAYQPIIASGKNACVLHYVTNDQPCRDGDLLLLDVAAEYANYNSDLTRTIPVNGRFTPRQRAVYDAVHRILRLCIDELIVPGKHMKDVYHKEVARATEEELIALGLLDPQVVDDERAQEDLPEEKRAYRKYFMHGVSHSLGLDVHDVTPAENLFVENMIVTVEPGIYLPEEGFGVRLENDIVVRTGGNLDLMTHIPIGADEIEARMAAARGA